MNKVSRVYLAIWRKALRDGGLELKVENYNQAIALRQSLYSAMALVKKGEVQDSELLQASDEFVVAAPKKGEARVVLRPRVALINMEALGLTEEDLMFEGERRAVKELEKLSQPESSEEAEEPSTNPFYSREN